MSKKKNKKDEEKEIEIKDEEAIEGVKSAEEEILEKEISDSKIAELEEKVKTLEDSLLRKVAEFENFRRRTENDQLNLLKYSAESFILKILPVYDDLTRSVQHLEESDTDSFQKGFKLVCDKFTKILYEQGVKKLDTKGTEFDVDYHEALMQQPSSDVPNNTVLEEIEPGYIYKDKVIRHAKVIVSQAPEDGIKDDNRNDNEEREN